MTDKQTKRQELGAVIRVQRERREWNHRRLANCIGASQSAIEAWEAGHGVPNSAQWGALRKRIDRSFGLYGELYRAACREDEEERQRITGAMSMHANGSNTRPTLAVSLGERIIAASPTPAVVTPEPAPPPAPVPRRRRGPYQPEPTGARAREAIKARDLFVRNTLRQRPAIRYGGDDGIGVLLHQRFGIGVSPARVEVIRAEVQLERARDATAMAPREAQPSAISHGRPLGEPLASAPAAPKQPVALSTDGDLEEAVGIVLLAIPGLRRFVITVDDNGEASVDYTVREVKVTERGGSIKVKRPT